MLDQADWNNFAQTARAEGFRGEIDEDRAMRAAMSTDNSVYQLRPDLIAAPLDSDDLLALLRAAARFPDIALTARGGGTGTNGQALNHGLIIDMRRHMNRLMAMDTDSGWADVEPGMVLDDLNDQLRPFGWFFAPETSTSSRCTIGGMVSTDASGKGSRVYGKTSDNILGLSIARAEGILNSLEPTPEWAQDMLAKAHGAALRGRAAFIANTPRLNRRFTGYDLERACPDKGGFNWWRLFPGAEGTLGPITQIRVKLTRLAACKGLIVVAFDSFRQALAAANPLLAADPTAVEIMDETVQAIAEKAGILRGFPSALHATDGRPTAYLFIEINDAAADSLADREARCRAILARLPGVRTLHVAHDADEIRALWAIRSAGVGLLGRVDGPARPVAFVEDTVVPPQNLPAFIDDFLRVLEVNGLGFGIYGHVDVGCLHIRPALNIDNADDRARLVRVSDAVYALTRKHGGIFWGEHGKGVRGAYLRDWIGEEAYSALTGVKTAFDPDGRFNPGKLVSPGTQILGIATTPFRAFNAADDDPLRQAFRCNGNAQCLSYAARTQMCPSFKATADLRHSPKGRADALRDWHAARAEGATDLDQIEADLLPVLDGCLGCKACASSCPVQVDIPAMRSAFLADYHARHRRSLVDRLTLWAERLSPVVLRAAPVLAPVWPLAARLAERITGLVDLPSEMSGRGLPWLRERDLAAPLPSGTVIVVQDWFTALWDGQAQRDVVRGLRALGHHPRLLAMRPAGKAAHDAGDLAGFRTMAARLVELLDRAAATGAPLVAFEPAFGIMLRQEYHQAGLRPPQVQMIETFLAAHPPARRAAASTAPVTLMSHCTQATADPQTDRTWQQAFDALDIPLRIPASGCCGMAGLFGHQARHQKMSRRLFDLSWRQPVEAADRLAATGFSCRCQIKRLSPQRPRHPLGIIADALGDCERSDIDHK